MLIVNDAVYLLTDGASSFYFHLARAEKKEFDYKNQRNAFTILLNY